jgi:hypothetical protein
VSTKSLTLADALPLEMHRVREEVMPVYQTIPTGAFAVLMMKQDLLKASAAMAEQDTVGMLRAYEALKGYKL